jgi:hypothetical protein
MSFTGSSAVALDQVTPVGVDQSTASLSVSGNITTVNANAFIIDAVAIQDSNATLTATATTPQTKKVDTGLSPLILGMSYNGPIITPASTSDGWSYSATTKFGLAISSMKPATIAGNCAACNLSQDVTQGNLVAKQ